MGYHQVPGEPCPKRFLLREDLRSILLSRLCPLDSGEMLRPKQLRPRIVRADWFRPKLLPHFDPPMVSRAAARLLACNPRTVASHAFLPLLSFKKRHRRFTSQGGGAPRGSVKERPLAACANRDATIFAYYAHLLRESFEGALRALNLGSVVVGYRRGLSNVEIAHDAFDEIAARGRCKALALDIEGFFDNIPHAALKRGWIEVLGPEHGVLPDDHYAVFRALTRYSEVDRDQCIERLGLTGIPSEGLPKPLCSIQEFRRLVRGDGSAMTSLIATNKKDWGIPQGTPLSPIAANIAMLAFDAAVASAVHRVGGSYRRYSDDILVICAAEHAKDVEQTVSDCLAKYAPGLHLKESKAQRVEFFGKGMRSKPSPLQYLGFTFDGRQILLRGATLARQWRRMAAAARWAKRRHRMALSGVIEGRTVVHRKTLLTRYSHLGVDNFHTGYAERARKVMGSRAIRRQLRRHMSFLDHHLR